MNRYLSAAWAYIAFTLILIGIAGLSWDAFRPDGWVENNLGALMEAEMRDPLLVTPIIIGLAILIPKLFHGNLSLSKKRKSTADIFVYVMMFAGAYYTLQWLTA